MLKLIVNADDLGAGNETDRGIFQAFTDGLVTSASLLATGPSAPRAVPQAKDLGLPLGVHLNLSEGFAVTGPLAGLTDAGGKFLGKQRLRDILAAGRFDPAAVTCELTAQIELARSFGCAPDHLDTHQHIFLWPSLTSVVIDLAINQGVSALRAPFPVGDTASGASEKLRMDLACYRQLSDQTRRTLRSSGLRYPDGLLGMDLLNRLNRLRLLRLIEHLPAQGCLELMVHPGFPDPVNPFGGPEREEELQALNDPGVLRQLRQTPVDLINFGDLACAC